MDIAEKDRRLSTWVYILDFAACTSRKDDRRGAVDVINIE